LNQSRGLTCPMFLWLFSKGKFHNVGPDVGHNADGGILSHCHIFKHRMGSLWQFRRSSQLQILRPFRTSQMPSTHPFSAGVIGSRLRLNAPGLRSQISQLCAMLISWLPNWSQATHTVIPIFCASDTSRRGCSKHILECGCLHNWRGLSFNGTVAKVLQWYFINSAMTRKPTAEGCQDFLTYIEDYWSHGSWDLNERLCGAVAQYKFWEESPYFT